MKKILIAASALACALTGIVAVSCDKTEEVSFKFDTLCDGAVTVEDITVEKGEEFTLPTPPSRGKEWEFGGWYLSSDFSGAPQTSVIADAETTYYAKWDRRYKINLDLGGGSLVKTDGSSASLDDLYLKAGENVSLYLMNYTSEKSGYLFGQWLNGSTALGGNFRMPNEEISLTARYKVEYKLDVYTQNLKYLLEEAGATTEFDKETLTLYEYPTSDFTVDYSLTGFTETVHAGDKVDGEIVDNPQSEDDNHFAIYFNRNQYLVTLDPNVAGTAQEKVSRTLYYEEEYALPYDLYSNVGYIFAGWSQSAYGQNDYPIDYIDAVLYNKAQGDDAEVTYENPYFVSGDATLYAYWNKGYSDLYGGADTIFVMDDKKEDIYLLRGGMFFKGSFTTDTEFIFNEKPDDINWEGDFEGKILNEDKFCYHNESLEGRAPKLFEVGKGLNQDVTLRFLYFNELTYTEGSGADAKVARGTFEVDLDTGEYTATFTSGEGDMVGKTVKFILATASDGQGNTSPAFVIRNEKEFALGTIQRLGLASSNSIGSFGEAYALTFNGYGSGVWNYGTTPREIRYAYNEENDTYTIAFSNQTLSIKIFTEGGYTGYMFYFSQYDTEFETENGKLTLDGLIHARYESGASNIVSGYYMMDTSYFGGNILTFNGSGTTYTFLMKANTDVFGNVESYTVTRKPNGYMEYYYYDGKSEQGRDMFLAPMLVLNDEEEGKANLYESSGGSLVKSATGTYAPDEESGLYVFTFTSKVAGIDHSRSRYDITDLKEFVFALDPRDDTTGSATSNRIYYNYSVTGLPTEGAPDGVTTDRKTEYAPDTKNYPSQAGSKLIIVGGIAILTIGNDESTYIGTYQTVDRNGTKVTVVTTARGYIYLEIDEANHVFFRYESTIGTLYLYKEDGTWEEFTRLDLDGKGGATYTIPDPNAVAGDENASIVYTGTVREEEVGADETPTFVFEGTNEAGESRTFRYILLSDSNRGYFAIISDKQGTFTSENSGTLELDGTGFELTYISSHGTYSGRYLARTDSVIYTYINGEYLYFELDTTHNTFTLLGSEYGMYMYMDNQYADGRVFEFDGKNTVKVSRIQSNGGEGSGSEGEGSGSSQTSSSLQSVATGSYTVEDDVISIHYELEGKPVDITGKIGVLQIGSSLYSVFFKTYDSAAYTFANEADYSVIVFDDAGGATRYLQTGGREYGSYTLITDKSQGADYNILYYVNNAGTYATVYEYDTETHLISAVHNRGAAYFNNDFESLRFTQYGFAIFNGTERYYYYDEGNNVAIYRVAAEGVTGTPNGYGFIKKDLGDFAADTISYEGETYHKNDGFDLVFERGGTTAEYPFTVGDVKYALTDLRFSPTGNMEFDVDGTATVSYTDGGATKTDNRECTVVRRALKGEGQTGYETFVTVGDFRFDISLTYKPYPAKCSYTVDAMSLYIDAASYTLLYNIQKYYPIYGSQLFNMLPDFGSFTVTQPYGADGEPSGDMKASGEIGNHVEFLDANGKAITSFTDLPCEVEKTTANKRTTYNYTVTLDKTDTANGGDGYIYKGVYMVEYDTFGIASFFMLGFYREQTITKGDLAVTVGRIIVSDNPQTTPGSLLVPGFTDGGQDVQSGSIFGREGDVYYVSRETEADGKILSSVYYEIKLAVKSDDGEIVEDAVLPYDEEKTTITKLGNATTVYAANGNDYVDIDEANHKVFVYCRSGRYFYTVTESVYDEATNSYVITTASAKYKVTITEDGGNKTATIETYVEPETPETTD